MRIAIIGRTQMLLETAKLLYRSGFVIPVVWTCRSEAFYKAKEEDFKCFAESVGADFYNEPAINQPENLTLLRQYNCDLAVSLNWLTMLKGPVLSIFQHGILNAHAGDLPRYRGNACPNWAILNGEKEIGLSIHKMALELDAGPVFIKKFFPLQSDTYIGAFYTWLLEQVPKMFLQVAQSIEQGKGRAEEQSVALEDVLRVFPRRSEDAHIEWSDRVEKIYRLIRASSRPFSGAFTFLEGKKRLLIWRAEPCYPEYQFCAVPGQVCFSEQGEPVIACVDGMLRLQEVSFDDGQCAKKAILKSLRHRLSPYQSNPSDSA